MSRRRHNQTRIKIDSPDADMIDKIINKLEDEGEVSFMCLPGPVKESGDGGYHVFVNVRELK